MTDTSVTMKGITLIELSVALSILAILAAVLLPRIAQLQRAARVGELRYLHGTVSARVMLVHIAARLRQDQPDTRGCAGGPAADNRMAGGTVCTDGGLVPIAHGHPAPARAGVSGVLAAPDARRLFNLTPQDLPAERFRVRVDGSKTVFMRADAERAEDCSFTYSQALDATTAAAISVPVVSGC